MWNKITMNEKIEKLKALDDQARLRLIYEWVKTCTISLKEFKLIMDQFSPVMVKETCCALNDYDDHDYKLVPKCLLKENDVTINHFTYNKG